jgi:hypothetical protein
MIIKMITLKFICKSLFNKIYKPSYNKTVVMKANFICNYIHTICHIKKEKIARQWMHITIRIYK